MIAIDPVRAARVMVRPGQLALADEGESVWYRILGAGGTGNSAAPPVGQVPTSMHAPAHSKVRLITRRRAEGLNSLPCVLSGAHSEHEISALP